MFVAARATPSNCGGWGVGGVGRICRGEGMAAQGGIGCRRSTGREQGEHGRLRRHQSMADCVGGWMADCVGGWMADCVGGWMADCVGG